MKTFEITLETFEHYLLVKRVTVEANNAEDAMQLAMESLCDGEDAYLEDVDCTTATLVWALGGEEAVEVTHWKELSSAIVCAA